jgi:RNA polymerase sigma-70 factor (ECF subfamily)
VIKVVKAPDSEESRTDEELVEVFLAGQEEVFAHIYERYYSRAYRMAYAMTGRHEAAEDLVQEIFMRAYQKLNQFGRQSSFSTWFYRLAVNRSINYRHERRRENERAFVDPETVAAEGAFAEVEAKIFQKQVQDQIHTALLALKPRLRMTVILKEIEGMRYEEIAERMNCSMGTIASRLNRARKLLAQKLEHLKDTL